MWLWTTWVLSTPRWDAGQELLGEGIVLTSLLTGNPKRSTTCEQVCFSSSSLPAAQVPCHFYILFHSHELFPALTLCFKVSVIVPALPLAMGLGWPCMVRWGWGYWSPPLQCQAVSQLNTCSQTVRNNRCQNRPKNTARTALTHRAHSDEYFIVIPGKAFKRARDNSVVGLYQWHRLKISNLAFKWKF